MTIHTRKLPAFSLYAAYTDEFGVPVLAVPATKLSTTWPRSLAARTETPPQLQSLYHSKGTST